MQPTVAEVLALPVLQAGAPEVVSDGPLDRPVRWVHVSELADLSNLLEGDELVLTTGLALTDDRSRDAYLPGLAAAGAAGVVIELGAHLPELPASVLRSADGLPLPVVVLHRRIRFVEVTEQVHRRIVTEQYAEVDHARRVHERFTALSLHRPALEEIVTVAAELLQAPVVLEDLNRQVIAFARHNLPTATLLADWERRSRLAGPSTPGAPRWLMRPVGPYRQEWGRLVAPTLGDDGSASSQSVMTLERAAQALALGRMIEQDRVSLELRAHSGLVDELRRGRVRDEAEATSRAHALGLQPALTYLPVTVRLAERVVPDPVAVQQRRARALDAVLHAVRAGGHSALAAGREDGQIDLLLALRAAADADAAERALEELCAAMRRGVARLDGVRGCSIGVGPESPRLVDAAGGLAIAAHVAEVAATMPASARSFHRAADVRLRGLVGLIRADPRVQAFAETELRAVLADRAANGPAMFDLLRAFVEAGGNKTELAKRLHLSRPTLYSRLAALQRLLGVDLDDAESRTSLHVAMLIMLSADRRHDEMAG
ncbi:PucR family transcriptional regulator [[Mycobacterium] wendilense]|uniref:PucR family transcriptional regulator n=1 Tax=[Mycobacterium] wendilense TaxID=3064284 RepID=A0ABN9P0S3_9MYCO|nr:PucR family transcriptional regulator [Mycolicibacterium sp. MU0050]CAJ1581367.1 PucR family transcriptional regulator [Mycolicibacterium sp. MU0050]